MSKDAITAMRDRVSTRNYLPETVSDEVIYEILESAHYAPSAGNLQPWEFYVVKDQEKINKLVEACHNQKWISDASAIITVCALPDISADEYGRRGASLYVIQDTAAAIENIILAAEAYDLGSCWIGAFDENKVKLTLGIKEETWPIALVTIGYSEEKLKDATPSRSLDEIVTFIN
ncbi:nitroreductase family protein [Halanaerocella petrolearia]